MEIQQEPCSLSISMFSRAKLRCRKLNWGYSKQEYKFKRKHEEQENQHDCFDKWLKIQWHLYIHVHTKYAALVTLGKAHGNKKKVCLCTACIWSLSFSQTGLDENLRILVLSLCGHVRALSMSDSMLQSNVSPLFPYKDAQIHWGLTMIQF